MSGPDLFAGNELVAALETNTSLLLAISEDELIRYANPAALAELGYSADELVGQSARILVPPDMGDRHRERLSNWFDAPHPRPSLAGEQIVVQRKDGSQFPVEIAASRLSVPAGDMLLIGMSDISEREEAAHFAQDLAAAHLAMAELNDAAARATDPEDLLAAGVAAFTRTDPHAVVTAVRPNATELPPAIRRALGAAGTAPAPYIGVSEDGHNRVAVLPVLREGRSVMRIVIQSPGSALDNVNLRSVLETMAGNLSQALDRLVQRDRLLRVSGQRIDLFRRLLDAQDEERRRVADDVHDDSVQALAALQLKAGLLHQRLLASGDSAATDCSALTEGLGKVMASLRTLIFELEPVSAATSLGDVVNEVVAGVSFDDLVVRDVEVDWSALSEDEHDAELLDLPPHLRGQAARILKEALRNTARHSQATWVKVVLTPDRDGVAIAVVDDGVGFDGPADAPRSAPGHRGVSGMLDRAALCGGWARLERDDELTILRFWLPRAGLAPDAIAAADLDA